MTTLQSFECVVQYLQIADSDEITVPDLVKIMDDNLKDRLGGLQCSAHEEKTN